MSNMISIHHEHTWRDKLLARADHLDHEAASIRLIAQADDPEDAAAVATDIATAMGHIGVWRLHGANAMSPPAPRSKLFGRVASMLRDKLVAVAELLEPSERRRLHVLVPALFASLAAADRDVLDALIDLLPHSPEVIALWLQLNLPTIESRFAS